LPTEWTAKRRREKAWRRRRGGYGGEDDTPTGCGDGEEDLAEEADVGDDGEKDLPRELAEPSPPRELAAPPSRVRCVAAALRVEWKKREYPLASGKLFDLTCL
jgi:hypothetical protein